VVVTEDSLSSLRSSRPGAVVFAIGLVIWFATGGFLFMLALPVMGLGAFLLLFAALVAKHSSSSARIFSASAAVAAVMVIAFLLWPIGSGA
jgi:hypothetical protein